jgi:hypothetical protein
VTNPNLVNINQLSIPISSGEQVEIRVQAISEAGWPLNPAMSPWSSTITVPFPADLEQAAELSTTLQQSTLDQVQVNFNQQLTSMGLDTHLSSSFVKGDTYYAHSSNAIASGFFNSDGSIIDLFSALQKLQNDYNTLLALVQQVKGLLEVTLVDPAGNIYIISTNSVLALNSPYYQDRVNALPSAEQKGAIFTDIYQLKISNPSATPLQLVSSMPGGVGNPITTSGTGSDTTYDKSQRYDLGFLSLSGLNATSTVNGENFQVAPFQSSQIFSQFIYSRYTDIGLLSPIIESTGASGTNPVPSNFTLYPSVQPGGNNNFVWNGNYDSNGAPVYSGAITDFCVHIDHPLLHAGDTPSIIQINQPTFSPGMPPAAYPGIVHAYSFERTSTSTLNPLAQARYCLPGATADNPIDNYPVKLGFYNNDRYLIGPNTCGAYLYLSPSTYTDIMVNGSDYRATTTIKTGDANAIVIPLIFQYRMTDYYGVSNTGTGNIGGNSGLVNLTYVKKVGFDILPHNESVFSFDIQITAKYKAETTSQISGNPSQTASSFASNITNYFDKYSTM